MPVLEQPPEWKGAVTTKDNPLLQLSQDAEIQAFVNRMNDRYFYWDEVKYREHPRHITPAMAWSFVKLSRLLQRKPLPLDATNGRPFGYWLPDSVFRELHFIDQHATGQILVDEPAVGKPERDRYIISSLMEEAIASSILEGAATTRQKAKEMLRQGRVPETRGERMIHNNYSTMLHIKERADEELTVELLCEIQAAMTHGTLDDATACGRLRRADEDVQVVDMTDGTILHTPPPADDLVPRLRRLCAFANTEQEHTFLHPVVKGIILHFWLAYEHPFVDGNGRTARALFYWYLMKHRYWLIEFLPISRIILKAPAKYKKAFLYAEEDGEDLTYFILFHLRAFHLSIEDLGRYIAKKQQELREAGRLLKRFSGLNHRQQELIGHALRHPDAAYTLARHAAIHGVVYQTARTDLHGLVTLGLLRQEKAGRAHVFLPSERLAQRLKKGKMR